MFSYPALLWFLPLVGLVLLIHLINMFRYRRVPWAAMEFLLASYRKSRTRILLQQVLLMLLRALAVALIVMTFAQPKFEGHWNTLFAGKATHHIVLLDDSFSMNDRNADQGGTLLFDEATAAINRIVQTTGPRGKNDRFSLILLSQAISIENGNSPGIAELPINEEGLRTLSELVRSLRPSQCALSPDRLFSAATAFLKQSSGKFKSALYFLSDFRRKDWENPTTIIESIENLRSSGALVRMIRVANTERPNLAIEHIRLVDGIHAADVDILLDATLVNHGQEDIENVYVSVSLNDRSQPGLTVPKIVAGSRTVPPVRFSIRPDGPGEHRVELQLSPDAIDDDNHRFVVLNVPPALEILLIGPDTQADSGHTATPYVRVALSPGGTKSGIRTRVEPPAFLIGNTLTSYHAIFLLDVPRLEPAAVRTLEAYVAQGGGLAVFVGPQSDTDFLKTELFKNGEGLFPMPPLAPALLEPDFLARSPDIRIVEQHPIFRLFDQGESPLLSQVRVERYLAVQQDFQPDASETTLTTEKDRPFMGRPRILATLRNNAPLVLEQHFWRGRIATFLTSASPDWNNWARGNPSFVVVMLELAAWLAKRTNSIDSLLVGNAIPWSVDTTQHEPMIRVVSPPDGNEPRPTVLVRPDSALALGVVSGTEEWARFTSPDASMSGFYTATLKNHSGEEEQRFAAVNVDASEGDTDLAELGRLSDALRSASISLEHITGFSANADFVGDRSWGDLFLLAILLLLVSETFLAGRMLPAQKRNYLPP